MLEYLYIDHRISLPRATEFIHSFAVGHEQKEQSTPHSYLETVIGKQSVCGEK